MEWDQQTSTTLWWMDGRMDCQWPSSLTADGPANFTYLAIESVHVQ
jgi:hypothetical protein